MVVGSIWAVPGPPSGCFVGVECVGHFEVVERCKFEQSQASVIGLCVTVGPTCAFPVFLCIFSDLRIPFPLNN